MVQCLFLKERVVHRFFFAVILLLAHHAVVSQPVTHKKTSTRVTLAAERADFHQVIQRLTQLTGLHFIYSSNKVGASKRVSISVQNKPIEEVFVQLARQMNVVFKRKDGYVIIKPAEAGIQSATSPQRRQADSRVTTTDLKPVFDTTDVTAFAGGEPLLNERNSLPIASASDDFFRRYAKDLQFYFDTTFLKTVPPQSMEKLNVKNSHRGWFVSAGFLVNDYSVGAEIQAGIRAIYLVCSPTWIKQTALFHGAYGLGSSIMLTRNFSLNPTYTVATVKETEDFVLRTSDGIFMSGLQITSNHRQLRLMVQYALTKNILLRLGPSFNRALTEYTFTSRPNVFLYNSEPGKTADTPFEKGSFYSNSSEGTAISVNSPAPQERFQWISSWVGWEAGVSYKINFFKRP